MDGTPGQVGSQEQFVMMDAMGKEVCRGSYGEGIDLRSLVPGAYTCWLLDRGVRVRMIVAKEELAGDGVEEFTLLAGAGEPLAGGVVLELHTAKIGMNGLSADVADGTDEYQDRLSYLRHLRHLRSITTPLM